MSIQSLEIPNKKPTIQGLDNDTQSGAILAILEKEGFREKMKNGESAGKNYAIFHIPQQKDFTVMETWQETDSQGKQLSKKQYYFFKIGDTSPTPTNPVIDTPPVSQEPEPHPGREIKPEQIPELDPTSSPTNEPAPAPEAIPAPSHTSSLEILRKKIKQENITAKPVFQIPEKTPESIPLSPERVTARNELLDMYKEYQTEWELVKKIPLDAFLHPEKYQWGNDTVQKTVSQYPATSKTVFEKIKDYNFSSMELTQPLATILEKYSPHIKNSSL